MRYEVVEIGTDGWAVRDKWLRREFVSFPPLTYCAACHVAYALNVSCSM